MKRFNSDTSRKIESSTILGGNLDDNLIRNLASLDASSDEEDFEEESHEPDESGPSSLDEEVFKTVSREEVKEADEILYSVFGLNVISVFTRLILSGKLLPTDFVSQALAYKCQSVVRGISGVRYQKSWGIFWSAVRNIVKTRGILSFRDHFCIPSISQLVKYKKEMVKLCGLEESSLGKSGLQSKSTDLWIDSKANEFHGRPLAVSVSMDAKKIAVTKEGTEDMGGIANFSTKHSENEEFDNVLRKIMELWKQNDRASLFTLYDTLSYSGQEIVNKLSGLKCLEISNLKRLDKNQNLQKYIYVLRSQSAIGQELMKKLCKVQCSIIKLIADKRKSVHLLPKTEEVNLQVQGNYQCIKNLPVEQDNNYLFLIDQSVKKSKTLLDLPWPQLLLQLGNFSEIPRESKTFNRLFELCYLSSEQIFSACGLGTERPVKDMKSIYIQSHSFPSTLPPPGVTESGIVRTLCASMAPMTFGTNCQIQESGIFVKDGICTIPDFLICSLDNTLEFTVKTKAGVSNIFEIELDTLAQCVIDSLICDSRKGSLVLQYSELAVVVINIPPENNLAKSLLSLCDSYIKSDHCLAKRSKEMRLKQEQLRVALKHLKEKMKILGSYPHYGQFTSLGFDASSDSTSTFPDVPAQLKDLMNEKRKFLSKQARELVAINVSDMSGNPSASPHTTLAATFLSSVSLKVVGEKCIKEVIEMVEKKNCKCLNVGVDGESLHFATCLPDGTPGTELSLAKSVYKKLQSFSKESLVKMVSLNNLIEIDDVQPEIEEVEEMQEELIDAELVANLEDSLALVQASDNPPEDFSLEDIEDMLGGGSNSDKIRVQEIKKYKIAELRLICLKHILPLVKKKWLVKNIGQEKLTVIFQDGGKLDYSPCTVFHKLSDGFYRTVTFDFAHLLNLYRESAAKGKLYNMGLSTENLSELSRMKGFEYLVKIIALQNGKLKFDSMNQKAAAMLFSDKTVSGLKLLKDFKGAKCVNLVSMGLSALDVSGMGSDERIKKLVNLKNFIVEKNKILARLKRPDEKNITNELFMMTLCSIDSHLFTYLNLEFFNPRRKSTSTVEMLFGQVRVQLKEII